MASLSSASTWALRLARRSSALFPELVSLPAPALLLALELALDLAVVLLPVLGPNRPGNIFTGRSFNDPPAVSGLDDMIPRSLGSLASRFNPGTTVLLAERIKAMAVAGPWDTLRRLRSTDRARSKRRLLSRLEAEDTRLTGAPGLALVMPVGFAAAEALGLGGDCAMGPPSLRFRASQGLGRRAEKLGCQHLSSCEMPEPIGDLQRDDNINTEIPQRV